MADVNIFKRQVGKSKLHPKVFDLIHSHSHRPAKDLMNKYFNIMKDKMEIFL